MKYTNGNKIVELSGSDKIITLRIHIGSLGSGVTREAVRDASEFDMLIMKS